MVNNPIFAAILAGAAMLSLGACDQRAADSSASTTPPSPPLSENSAVGSGNVTTTEQTAPTPEAKPAGRQAVKLQLAVDGEGLRLFNPANGAATPIAFGWPQRDVLGMLERLRGPAAKGANKDCGAGPVDYATWPDGLSVVFQHNRFVGWGIDSLGSGALSTASGVGPGSTRENLEAAYADVSVLQSSLGTEFTAGGFSGLIDGSKASSRITHMWAGISCVAR